MARDGMRIHVRMNRLPEVAAKMPDLVNLAIQKFIMDVIRLADPDTPVDTGHLKNNKVIDIGILKAIVTWTAAYALYVHEGTRFMPARPFALDAFNRALPAMINALEDMERRL